jgi:hypothetical protein
MFCNQCGTQLQSDFNVCPRCGRPAQAPVPVVKATTRLQQHLPTLGILWMVLGGLTLLPAFFRVFLSSVIHVAIPFSNAVARNLGPLVMMVIGGSLLLIGAGGLLVGWGLMRHQPWARIPAIIVGVLALFHPPLLTALGIYTLWVLLGRNSDIEYQRLARTA